MEKPSTSKANQELSIISCFSELDLGVPLIRDTVLTSAESDI